MTPHFHVAIKWAIFGRLVHVCTYIRYQWVVSPPPQNILYRALLFMYNLTCVSVTVLTQRGQKSKRPLPPAGQRCTTRPRRRPGQRTWRDQCSSSSWEGCSTIHQSASTQTLDRETPLGRPSVAVCVCSVGLDITVCICHKDVYHAKYDRRRYTQTELCTAVLSLSALASSTDYTLLSATYS